MPGSLEKKPTFTKALTSNIKDAIKHEFKAKYRNLLRGFFRAICVIVRHINSS